MDDYSDVERAAERAGMTPGEYFRQSCERATEHRRVHGIDLMRVHLEHIEKHVREHVPGKVTVSGITFDAETALPVIRAIRDQLA